MSTASKTYAQFVSDLNQSQAVVLSVAAFLQRSGREVILPPHIVTPSEEERFNYQDSGDLRVLKTYQAKGSSRDFDSVEAFGFRMVTVDEVYKIKAQLRNPPLGYWIVNSSKSGAIFIPWETRGEWDEFSQNDALQGGRLCHFHRCPARLCRFVSFTNEGETKGQHEGEPSTEEKLPNEANHEASPGANIPAAPAVQMRMSLGLIES